MASASGGDLDEDNPWRTIVKGNAQKERSSKVVSDHNTARSDRRIASNTSSSSRSGGGAVCNNSSKRSGRDTASRQDGRERTMGGGDAHHHLTDLLSREELCRRTKERLCFDCG